MKRQLFQKIPHALTQLAPCLMMSPLSISQYLAPDADLFDVVIFDEASQIPVWEAVGAIARGRQAVIVGDPEQLPPTTFGERKVDEDDEYADVVDQESILDECLAATLPQRSLNWHYRSQFESLIDFSNQRYYQGRLVTFPSSVTQDKAVRYVHVPGGTYERGKGRVNREEARVVVAEIIRRLTSADFLLNKRSLGVVTRLGLIVSLALQVIQETQDRRGIHIEDVERRGRFAGEHHGKQIEGIPFGWRSGAVEKLSNSSL